MSQPVPASGANFDSARRLMVVSQLRPQGVTDPFVLAAMGNVAREEYVPEGVRASAYGDRSIKVADGSPMLPPAELGLLLTRLAPRPGERAMVIGGGGAYATGILRHIGLVMDGGGSPPVDLILVEGAIEHLPAEMAERLSADGRVGAAIVEDGVTRLAIGRPVGNPGARTVAFTSFAEAQVPILPGFSSAPAFAF